MHAFLFLPRRARNSDIAAHLLNKTTLQSGHWTHSDVNDQFTIPIWMSLFSIRDWICCSSNRKYSADERLRILCTSLLNKCTQKLRIMMKDVASVPMGHQQKLSHGEGKCFVFCSEAALYRIRWVPQFETFLVRTLSTVLYFFPLQRWR